MKKSLLDVNPEPYIFERKLVLKGSITICTNGCGLKESRELATRPVDDLEAVLVIDPSPLVGNKYRNAKNGIPINVIGIREIDSSEEIHISRTGFLHHPKHYHIQTSPHISRFIPLETYQEMMKNIETADDVLELRNVFNRYFKEVC